MLCSETLDQLITAYFSFNKMLTHGFFFVPLLFLLFTKKLYVEPSYDPTVQTVNSSHFSTGLKGIVLIRCTKPHNWLILMRMSSSTPNIPPDDGVESDRNYVIVLIKNSSEGWTKWGNSCYEFISLVFSVVRGFLWAWSDHQQNFCSTARGDEQYNILFQDKFLENVRSSPCLTWVTSVLSYLR